ncbi:hypothetical protein L226DRAFT_210778 [Lentinus tigrinus ALCF2SS1-7]|uniref:uncharacterized protein n=1 Tax=Lentinus tigrinus ALCF2SS1-7 TaxID=1328758 RepID=UPI00116622E1|nr:hypothetical protein L226DRAFT_210778 [Lentinus tigrinus ALCF2SS1-7]
MQYKACGCTAPMSYPLHHSCEDRPARFSRLRETPRATSLPNRYPRPSSLGVPTLHPHTPSFNSSPLRSGISHRLMKAPECDYQAKKRPALTRFFDLNSE